ncbi:PREDICTED: guanylate-binding protein 6-like [Ceratotherium simum simum]|uniref:Guanylate-binding protein 6-like n=1 Tax=Ceratotherium simum simum TaxID=73337 RepID=A0ABM1C7X8_CERSS|nr:PREDICTED: guanylate-binding protein 6-like [Ceratotherium simum simum]
MEAQKRSLQENIAQLEKKLVWEREILMRQYNMMLEHKLKVQRDLLNEGFRKKAEEMSAEIDCLKNVIDTAKSDNTAWIAAILGKFGNEIISLSSAPAKLLGNLLKVTSLLFKKN